MRPYRLLSTGHALYKVGRFYKAIDAYSEASLNYLRPDWPYVHYSIRRAINKLVHHTHLWHIAERSVDYYATCTAAIKALRKYPLQRLLVGHQLCNTPLTQPTLQPLVSIIMPTHNRRPVLMQAIASVLQQTYTNWELIVCDDGSTDDTAIFLSRIEDTRIRYYVLPKTNAASARNAGLRMANGSLIAFLDSDNLWHPCFLWHSVTAHSDYTVPITYTDYCDLSISGESITSAAIARHEFNFSRLLTRNYIDLNTLVFKNTLVVTHGGFDGNLLRQQDWDLLIRYTVHATPLRIPRVLMMYRRNDDWNQITALNAHIDTRSRIQKKIGPRHRLRLRHFTEQYRMVRIKIAAPTATAANTWGDYHFAVSLARELDLLGYKTAIDTNDRWYTTADHRVVNLVLRGRHRYVPKHKSDINILWLISHPERPTKEEYNSYDHVFVASETYLQQVLYITSTPSSLLLQATDASLFYRTQERLPLSSPILFVGNSRKEFRTMIKWCRAESIAFALYGPDWRRFLPPEMIQGEFIPNQELSMYYSSCGILLNDHWETMRAHGFISNRLFDASACACFCITDRVDGLQHVFGNLIETAADQHELRYKISYYMRNHRLAREKAIAAQRLVYSHHTFANRALDIHNKISHLRQERVYRPNANHE